MNIKNALPWLIPLLVSMLLGGYQIWSLVDRVEALEESDRTKGEAAIRQLQSVDSRVARLEEFCCGELERFEEFIKTH